MIEDEYGNHPDLYFKRELLGYTSEKRRIELLTISSHADKILVKEKYNS